jgi:ABC-type multidrug transport system fused ATPase/permease subunit
LRLRQRQRIAIARAILADAPIFVLDEPTSALDPASGILVMQSLNRLRRRYTLVLVTHHITSVTKCDQIFVMQDGAIVERGTHDNLIALDGAYAAMFRTEHATHGDALLYEAA